MACNMDVLGEAIRRGLCVSAKHDEERLIIAPYDLTDVGPPMVRCILLEADGFEVAPTHHTLLFNKLSDVCLTRRIFAAQPQRQPRTPKSRPIYAGAAAERL